MFRKVIIFLNFLILNILLLPSASAEGLYKDNFDGKTGFPSGWHIVNDGSPCTPNWYVEDGMLKVSIIGQEGCTSNIVPNDDSWLGMGDTYEADLDMTLVRGSDHNFVFRFISDPPRNGIAEVHFQAPGDFVVSVPVGISGSIVPKVYFNGSTYHLKVVLNKKSLQVFVDGLKVRDLNLSSELPKGGIALRTGGSSETWFDNIVVRSIDSDNTLNVPLFKQNDPAWKNIVYDSARSWSPNYPTISSWGCALTSGAMVLRYHGITKLPGEKELNPGNLNSWLMSQVDGYVGGGLVNWLALSRLSKTAKSLNPAFSYNALEYSRNNGQNDEMLKQNLNDQKPVILDVSNHFVVGKGFDVEKNTFKINDPLFERENLLSYDNKYYSMGVFKPSNTDLSYILAVVDPNVKILLKDSKGNIMGDASSDQYKNFAEDKLGYKKLLYYLPKPENDTYTFSISATNEELYDIEMYLYNKDGEVKVFKGEGIVGSDNSDLYNIVYDKNNLVTSKINAINSLKTLKGDLEDFLSEKLITDWEYKRLSTAVIAAEKNRIKNIKESKRQLLTMLDELEYQKRVHPDIHIKLVAYQVLKQEIQAVIDSLKVE